MSENKYPIGGYAPLKQLLDDLIECVINDRLVLGATPNGRPHDPDPEIDRLRKEILNIYGKPAGSVWVKAHKGLIPDGIHSMKLVSKENVVMRGTGLVNHNAITIITFLNKTTMGVSDLPKDYEGVFWLNESGTASNKDAVDPEELWDEHSEYINDDVDSLTRWAGSAVMTREGFKKLWQQSKSK